MSANPTVFIGWDTREIAAYEVAKFSIRRRTSVPVSVFPLHLGPLSEAGLYTRAIEKRDGNWFDPISDAPMATEFAISRFLVPHIFAGQWAVFMDCDVLILDDITKLFALADDRYAVQVVKHDYRPNEATKMDGQVQTVYSRKNWSSVMLFNCWHPANRRLTLDMINNRPGRDLHGFCWLEDHEIGELPVEWNWLEGHSPDDVVPKLVHFTRGGPWFKDYRDVAYADRWIAEDRVMMSFYQESQLTAL